MSLTSTKINSLALLKTTRTSRKGNNLAWTSTLKDATNSPNLTKMVQATQHGETPVQVEVASEEEVKVAATREEVVAATKEVTAAAATKVVIVMVVATRTLEAMTKVVTEEIKVATRTVVVEMVVDIVEVVKATLMTETNVMEATVVVTQMETQVASATGEPRTPNKTTTLHPSSLRTTTSPLLTTTCLDQTRLPWSVVEAPEEVSQAQEEVEIEVEIWVPPKEDLNGVLLPTTTQTKTILNRITPTEVASEEDVEAQKLEETRTLSTNRRTAAAKTSQTTLMEVPCTCAT